MVIVLIFGGLVAVTFLNYQNNKKDILNLAQDFLAVLEERIRAQAEGVLLQARRVVEFGAEIVADNPNNIGFEALAVSALRKLELISAVYVARDNGDFLMVRKNEEGGFDTKRITNTQGERQVTLTKRNRDGTLLGREELPDDTYDPRERVWYQLAVESEGRVAWTEIYQFFTSSAPGTTAAMAVRGPDGEIKAVVGTDVRVDTLSRFLMDLEVVENGHAALLSGKGDVIAAPSLIDPDAPPLNADHLPSVEDLGDPALVRAYDIMRVRGSSMEFTRVEDQKVFMLVSSLAEATDTNLWIVLIAPESDFTHFLTRNSLGGLAISGVLILCVLGLAVWLFMQSRRIDRRSRETREQHNWLAGVEGVFESIRGTLRAARNDPAHALAHLTEALAISTGARSASIWRRYDDELRCIACYNVENSRQTLLMPIEERQAPEIFGALSREEVFTRTASEAGQAFATRSRSGSSLAPDAPILFAPVLARSKGFGLVVLEAPELMQHSEMGARLSLHYAAAAALLAFEVEGLQADRDASRPGTGQQETPAATALLVGDPTVVDLVAPARPHRFSARQRQGPPTAVPGLTVLELVCRDDAGLGRALDGDRPLFDAVVQLVRSTAERHDLSYVKLLGNRFQLATGLFEDETEAADRLLDTALALQYDLRALLRSQALEPAFGIGIDTGTGLGWSLSDPAMINLWGGPARLAERLAESAPNGAIQVGGRSVALLSDRFVFRRRGRYHLDAGACIEVSLVVGRAA